MLTIFFDLTDDKTSTILGKTIVQQFLREPLSGWSISVKDGKFEKVLSGQVSDALPPSRLEAESRPDPNAGKTGGQAWG